MFVELKSNPPPTPEKLSELACILSKGENAEPRALVKRALEIWHAAIDELSGTKLYQASDQILFGEIAEKKMLPSLRAKFGSVDSSKGVGKAVDRYFELLVNEYDQVMKGRQIDPQLQKSNKDQIQRLRKTIGDEKQMPKRVLDLLTQFQLDMRNKSHQVSASEIREVLGGVDVGTPPHTDL